MNSSLVNIVKILNIITRWEGITKTAYVNYNYQELPISVILVAQTRLKVLETIAVQSWVLQKVVTIACIAVPFLIHAMQGI